MVKMFQKNDIIVKKATKRNNNKTSTFCKKQQNKKKATKSNIKQANERKRHGKYDLKQPGHFIRPR